MSDLKVLVCGDVDGHFQALFSKADVVNKKKGPFECLLCVGSFFDSDNEKDWIDVLAGKIKVPITTYILGPNEPSHLKYYLKESGEVGPNILHLGKRGVLKSSSGLTIAYLSGVEKPDHEIELKQKRMINEVKQKEYEFEQKQAGDTFRFGKTYEPQQDSSNSKTNKERLENSSIEETKGIVKNPVEKQTSLHDCLFSEKDVDELVTSLSSVNVVDILLTAQWPAGISRHEKSHNCGQDSEVCSSLLISRLAKLVKPRYHFAGLAGKYYERLPYRNHEVLGEKPVNNTRFVGLAPVANVKKEKWLYAINITPASSLDPKKLLSCDGLVTECPFDASFLKVPETDINEYFFKREPYERDVGASKRHKSETSRPVRKSFPRDPDDCWFCLSNPAIKKHLLITVGDHCYLSLAKGVLVPDHLLIIPIYHTLASVNLSDSAANELDKFKAALVSYCYDKGKNVVFFERSYASSHLQVQVVPVPKLPQSAVKDSVLELAKEHNLLFHEVPNFSRVKQIIPQGKSYFYIEIIVDKQCQTKLLHIVDGKFPLQFGRMVLASRKVLNVPTRVDWKCCLETDEQEKKMAGELRKSFEPYDFTK